MPTKARARYLLVIFLAFTPVGFLLDLITPTPGKALHISVWVLASGLIAVAYTYCFLRLPRLLPVLATAHVAWVYFFLSSKSLQPFIPNFGNIASAPTRIDLLGCFLATYVGYFSFMRFTRTQGLRHVRVETEIALAQQIHRSLVPRIQACAAHCEFYGMSVPSGEMGGDLIDLVQHGTRWIGYLADVSGHGVPSGVLMAMVKSAARMRLTAESEMEQFLDDLNHTLFDLKSAESFVTLAYLATENSHALIFATAGHLPILHIHHATSTVSELSTSNPPLGVFAEQPFETSRVEFSAGDIAIILSDGLTETTNGSGEEYGLERVKRLATKHSGAPLNAILDALLADVRKFGKQMDDQSVLLVRCL